MIISISKFGVVFLDNFRHGWHWFAAVFLIFFAGALGFHYIVGLDWVDSAFYSVITLTTVGYSAPEGLTESGKIFVIILVFAGIGSAGYALTQAARYLVLDRLLSVIGKRRKIRMDKIKNHWIICGIGKIGEEVARHMHRDGVPFIVLEIADRKVAWAREQGWIAQQGDARSEEALKSVYVENAKGIIAALTDDSDNVYVILTAKSLNPKIRAIARASDAQSSKILYKAGADKVVSPVIAGAAAIARYSVQPSVADFLELVNISKEIDIDFGSIHLGGNNPLIGKTLAEAPLRSKYNAIVIAVKRQNGSLIYNPPGHLMLEENDELIVFGERAKMAQLKDEVAKLDLKMEESQ
ncbi:MAG: voltage-gated potassium channel [Thermovirga sp.]|jgi:voltage-gated potassium channel|nr:voltage-gated potassium channel [Thermovirga sp.]